MSQRALPGVLTSALLAAALTFGGCSASPQDGAPGGGGATATTLDLMKARNLSEANVVAALKTYTPTGVHDEYFMFASGGHGGNVLVIGMPSMRILKYIAVFTPEPWQGYGYGDETNKILREGDRNGKELNWGDVHHTALSETAGDYDGQFLFVNDKANARIALISLKDFATKQIVSSNLIESNHGGAFVTPDTDYVIEGAQYPTPLGGAYAPIEEYNDKYRGAIIFWKFDRAAGRIVREKSFAIELPPYMQDLADVGKLASDGWVFVNSINTELSIGGVLEGRPPLESGASQNDMDYMHLIPWRKAAEVAEQPGKTTMIADMRVIPLQTAIDEGLLYFVGEPKSPHGVDVTPDGTQLIVSGKLDTHGTVYSWAKLKGLIDAKTFVGKDRYGVPILPFDKSIDGQVELGLGPLHTQFDDKGFAYTSIFIESKVAKWSYKDLKLLSKIPVHYNIGHLAAAEGDTVSPDGRFVVAMDKWAIDRFAKVGPLLPQNFQLIDISGDAMELLYDMPIPLGEPHYAQIIKADKLHAEDIYSPAGFNPVTEQQDPNAVVGGKERIERRGNEVHIWMTVVRSHFTPDTIRVKQGDRVFMYITNVEQAHDATHGFTIDAYNVNLSLEPGKHSNVVFTADIPGVFPMYCTEFCSALHLEMAGYFLVEPTAAPAPATPPPADDAAPPAPTPSDAPTPGDGE